MFICPWQARDVGWLKSSEASAKCFVPGEFPFFIALHFMKLIVLIFTYHRTFSEQQTWVRHDNRKYFKQELVLVPYTVQK